MSISVDRGGGVALIGEHARGRGEDRVIAVGMRFGLSQESRRRGRYGKT